MAQIIREKKNLGKVAKLIRSHGLLNVFRFVRYRLVLDIIQLLSRSIKFDIQNDGTFQTIEKFTSQVNEMRSPRILEIGSRNISRKRQFRNYSEYVGFDILAGNHVDVVGDVHRISKYFPQNHFDAVYSISVFEHLAMPWKAILEVNKVMKPGGKLLIATHPTYPPHAQPWDYWRYSRFAFSALLNERTGFKILDCVEGFPCVILPLGNAKETRITHRVPAFMLVTVIAEKLNKEPSQLSWDMDVGEVIKNTYPEEYKDGVADVFLDYLKRKSLT